jgi:dTDP-glucose 4,6-dehydratase
VTTPRAVIDGGSGFLGSHQCDGILAEGWDVVAVDSLLTGTRGNLAAAREHERFGFVRANVSEPLRIEGPVDWVLHLASPASPPDYLEHAIETLRVGRSAIPLPGPGRGQGAGFLSRPRRRCTGTRCSIRSPRVTGAT